MVMMMMMMMMMIMTTTMVADRDDLELNVHSGVGRAWYSPHSQIIL